MSQKPMPKIGVDFYHYVPVISDLTEGTLYDDAVRVLGQTAASYAPNSSSNPFYADNGTYISDVSLANQEVTLTLADVPPSIFSDMIGGLYNGALALGSGFVAKERGVLYRIKLSGSNALDPTRPYYRYFRFWKGTFTIPNMDATTQGETIDYQTSEFTYTAVNASGKDLFVQIIDDDDPNLANIGLTPTLLEEKIVDFNWDPFTGNPVFQTAQRVAVSPSVVEASETDGSVSKPIMIGLTSGSFSNTVTSSDLTAANLPAGLTIGAVTLVDSNVATVEISGAATDHTASDGVDNVTIEVAQTAIEGATAALTTKPFAVEFK